MQQPEAPRSQGAPDAHLARPFRGSHEQQVGDVRAGDQEHESYGRQQHEQRQAYRPDDLLSQRYDGRAPLGVGLRTLHGRLGGYGADVGPRGRQGRSPSEARDRGVVAAFIGAVAKSGKQLDAARKGKAWWHYADDRAP